MKTIKSFGYRELNIYLWDSEKQSIRVRDLLTNDRAWVFSSYHTDSRGDPVAPCAIFVEDDPLGDRGCQPCSWYFDGWPMDFILVPIKYNGNDYDAWIPLRKFNACLSQQEREELARRNPKYFSDKPEKRLGFFNEGIDTNFNEAEIIRIMTDTSLSSSEKCKRLFGRNEDYLIHVQWLCFRKSDKWIQYLYEHNYLTDDAKERYGSNYPQFRSDFAEVIDRGENDRNDSGKRTLFYDWRQGEEVPCDLDTSYSAYVVDGECNGSTVERRVRNWYNHIKFSVSYMEDRGYVIDRSGIKRLGFFNK